MTAKRRDTLTDGLGPGGLALVTELLEGYAHANLEADERERQIIRAAAECRDRLDTIGARIDEDGLITTTGRAHPLLGEERQRQAVLGRLLAGVSLADTGGKNAAKQRAANVRWSRSA